MKNLSSVLKYKHFAILSFLLIIYILVCAFSYVDAISSDLSDAIFRLHVIANSDSKEDQDLKYLIRDNLIEYMNIIAKDATTKEEAIEIAKAHKNDFYDIAINTIKENGFDYDVKINIGNFSFPTKTYGDISLPAGYYDALKVEIGEAARTKLVVCYVSSSLFCRCINRNCSR